MENRYGLFLCPRKVVIKMNSTEGRLEGSGIELKLNGKRILKASARPIDGAYDVHNGYRRGRYMTPLGEVGLEHLGWRGLVLVECSQAEVIQKEYPHVGDGIVIPVDWDHGKGSYMLKRGWTRRGHVYLNVRLEGVDPHLDAESNNRGWWVRKYRELPRTLAGPNGYVQEGWELKRDWRSYGRG